MLSFLFWNLSVCLAQLAGPWPRIPNLGQGHEHTSGWGPSHNDEEKKNCQNQHHCLGKEARWGEINVGWNIKVFRDNQPKYTWYINSSNGETLHQKIWTGIRGGQERNRKSLCKTKMCRREKGPPPSQRPLCSWFKEKLTFFFPFLIFMIYIFSQSSSNTAHYTLAA